MALVPAARGGDAARRAVPGGGQRASGAGSADGGHVGPSGGRDADGSPRFDQPVEPGAYLWWYVDAVSDDGRYGLTVIAFVGSVFSPYYRLGAAARPRATPRTTAAINVCLYGPGARRWTMTERGARHVQRSADASSVVGPSACGTGNDGALTVDIDERGATRCRAGCAARVRRAHAGPDAPSWPASTTPGATAGAHRPVARASRSRLDAPAAAVAGHAYLDSNEGDEPISEPFTTWDWMRAPLHDGSTVRRLRRAAARVGCAERLIARALPARREHHERWRVGGRHAPAAHRLAHRPPPARSGSAAGADARPQEPHRPGTPSR
jgi:carotenoid 1,2-hydratase